jgi:hypothetical protein
MHRGRWLLHNISVRSAEGVTRLYRIDSVACFDWNQDYRITVVPPAVLDFGSPEWSGADKISLTIYNSSETEDN